MVELGRKRRSKASHAVEAGLMSVIWMLNLYQIATGLRTMSLLAGLTAGMIFLIAPVEVWRAVRGFREYKG